MIGQLLGGRTFRLAVAMTSAVAVPIAILLFFQYRSLSDLEQTSRQVLEALSSQTVENLVDRIQADFRSPRFELVEVADESVERLDLPQLARVMARLGRSPVRAEAFYLWARDTGSPFDQQVLEFVTDTGGVEAADPMERFRPAGAEAAALVSLAEEMAQRRTAIGIETMRINGRRQVVVVRPRTETTPGDRQRSTLEVPTRGRLIAFSGFRIDLERVEHDYLPKAVGAFLAEANPRTRLADLVVTILDDRGTVVYQSAKTDPRIFVDERSVPLMFFDPNAIGLLPGNPWRDAGPGTWRVRAGYGDQTIADITRASTASHRWQLAFLLVLTAAGLFLGARALVHEVRLAELKSNFVASVSHELKTPLALIQLFAETLELGRVKTNDRAKEYYTIINAEARKLTALIDHILDLSRLESGVQPFTLEVADLNEVVRATLRDFETQFSHSGATVTSRLGSSPLLAAIDLEAVQVAIRNLLSNAIKYSTNRKEISVEVSSRPGYALVCVADHGIGIPRRQQRRIFQKFYRVEDGANEPGGTGLGLAIVEQVMRAHGGRVQVESEPGKGSVFTLSFPLVKDQPRAHEADIGDRGRASNAPGAA